MEVRHIQMGDGLSIMVSCNRITINAIDESDGAGLSFTLPKDLSEVLLSNSSSDEIMIGNCLPIAMQIKGFCMMMLGSFYSVKSPEDAAENFQIINGGLAAISKMMLEKIMERKASHGL